LIDEREGEVVFDNKFKEKSSKGFIMCLIKQKLLKEGLRILSCTFSNCYILLLLFR